MANDHSLPANHERERETEGVFGRAIRADSLLNPTGALPDRFLKRSDSLLIL